MKWVHHDPFKTKEQSKQWTKKVPGIREGKNGFVDLKGYGNCILGFSWNYLDRLLRKRKNSKWGVFCQFVATIKRQKQRETVVLAKNKVLFHQDNVFAHESAIAIAKIHELGLELVPDSPYFPDLGPSEYHLFPDLKKWLDGKRFSSNSDVIAAVNSFFEDLDSSTYNECITNLEYR